MKKLLLSPLFLALLVPIQFHAQEFDPNYLDSLPESVRKDVESQIEKNNEDLETTKKIRPSSELLKYDTVREWEEFKRKRNAEFFNSERYGINLFRTMQSSFMPINEPNFGNNYILDYGDVIDISLFGNLEEQYLLEIKRDGSISIPQIGSIVISGLTYDQGIKKITNQIKNAFIGVNVDIKLEKIRDIKVLMSGSIEFPGVYTLSGNSNVLQAINIAGGIKENGTLRDVEIKRNGKVVETIDLYNALILGDTSKLNQLQSGDSVYIKSAFMLVRAGSGFVNEALFELKEGEGIDELIKFSGGLNKKIVNKNFTLVKNNGKIIENLVSENDLENLVLNHLDSIYLPVINFGSVKISGAVKRPGIYTISSGDDVYDILERAGGYTDYAYSFGGILSRESTKKLELQYATKTYNTIINFLAINPDMLSASSNIGMVLEEIKDFDPIGRVVAEFNIQKLKDDPALRSILQDKDEIFIPERSNVVYVYGDVGNPSAVPYFDFVKTSKYISMAGGLNSNADKDHIFVVNPNGVASVIKLNRLSFLANNNLDIYPGSLIYVPVQMGLRGVDYYSQIAPIFSSLAISLASLNSIND